MVVLVSTVMDGVVVLVTTVMDGVSTGWGGCLGNHLRGPFKALSSGS